jgi:di- and tripeptidase
MLLGKGILPEAPDEEVLVSGGGDGRIQLWNINAKGGAIEKIYTLEDGRDEGESILSLQREGSFLYSGRLDGEINVWDLETRQLVRSLKTETDDVLTLTLGGGLLFAGGKSGVVQVNDSTGVRNAIANYSSEIQPTLRDSVDVQSARRPNPRLGFYDIQ